MAYFLLTMLFISGVFMILIILLQRGRGGGLAGAFGGQGGQSAFGTKAGDVFTKITIGIAVIWVVLAGTSGFFLRAGNSNFIGTTPDEIEEEADDKKAPIGTGGEKEDTKSNDEFKPDQKTDSSSKKDDAKSETTEPETSKSEDPKSEDPKSENSKSEATKPDGDKAEKKADDKTNKTEGSTDDGKDGNKTEKDSGKDKASTSEETSTDKQPDSNKSNKKSASSDSKPEETGDPKKVEGKGS